MFLEGLLSVNYLFLLRYDTAKALDIIYRTKNVKRQLEEVSISGGTLVFYLRSKWHS